MINEVTNDYYDLKKEIIRTCGRSFSLIDRINLITMVQQDTNCKVLNVQNITLIYKIILIVYI